MNRENVWGEVIEGSYFFVLEDAANSISGPKRSSIGLDELGLTFDGRLEESSPSYIYAQVGEFVFIFFIFKVTDKWRLY